MRHEITVTEFGARGDGRTDDAPAIQAALDSGAARVIIPAGLYLLSDCIRPRAGQQIEIRGTLKIAPAHIQPLAADAGAGQSLVRVASAARFRVGQWVTVVDDENPTQGGGRQVRPAWADCSRITAIEDNTLRLEGRFRKPYRVSAHARLATQHSAILIEQPRVRLYGPGVIDGNKAEQLDAEPFVMEGCGLRKGGGIGDVGGGEVRAGSCVATAGAPAGLDRVVIEGLTVRDAIVHNLCLTGLVRGRVVNTTCTGAHDKNITLLDCEDCLVQGNEASFSDFEDGIMLHQRTGNRRIMIQGNLCAGNPRSGLHIGAEETDIHTANNLCVDNGCNLSLQGRNGSSTGDVCRGDNERLFKAPPDRPRPGVLLSGFNLHVANLTVREHRVLHVMVRAEDLAWTGGLVSGRGEDPGAVGIHVAKAGPYRNSWTSRRVRIRDVIVRDCAEALRIDPETADITTRIVT